jgi:hypothetical protein
MQHNTGVQIAAVVTKPRSTEDWNFWKAD